MNTNNVSNANKTNNNNVNETDISCCEKCCIGMRHFFCESLFHLYTSLLLCCGACFLYIFTCGFCFNKRRSKEEEVSL